MKYYEVIIRLFLALIVGGAIGYEREFKNRPAGFRTHILVCVGAVVVSMIQIFSQSETSAMILQYPQLEGAIKTDVGRMGAQVISGIGFLGAGTIIHEKGSIKGLTTAASLWVVACIGLAIGMGYYVLGILSGISVVIVLVSLKNFETRFLEKRSLCKLEIKYRNRKLILQSIEEYFLSKEIKVKNIEFGLEEECEDNDKYHTSLYTLLVPKYIGSSKVMHDLSENSEIIKINIL